MKDHFGLNFGPSFLPLSLDCCNYKVLPQLRRHLPYGDFGLLSWFCPLKQNPTVCAPPVHPH